MTTPTALPLPHRFHAGSVRAVWSYRDYRLVWMGMFLSNVGTWMQNVALPAYVQKRTGSAGLVGAMVFAQLGPVLLLAIPGGVLASRVPRRALLVSTQAGQMVASILLAILISRDASFGTLFAANMLVGTFGAISAPAFQSTTPTFVDRRDLAGTISMNSVQLNGSRVIGPVVAAMLGLWGFSTSDLFLVNAATYLFVITALVMVTMPAVTGGGAPGWRSMTEGIRIARSRRSLSRTLTGMTIWSFAGLVYVGLFASIAELNFGIDPQSNTYNWLYAIWACGACVGAISSATVFAKYDKRTLVTPGLTGFAVSLAAFALADTPAQAFAVATVLGFFYFLTATAMATVFQQNLADHERPFAMSLWFMSFGGTVPLGNLAFGPLVDAVGPRPVLLGSAVVSLWLSRWCDLRRLAPSDLLQEHGGKAV